MVFNCILCYLSPKIVIFQEPLETNVIGYGMPQNLNMCDSSHFDTFLPVKINKMLNFCLKLWFFRNWLITETWYLWNWIWHTSNPSYAPLKPFWCIFPSQNQQNVKFLAFSLTPPDKKWKKKPINLNRKKVFEKAWISAHTGLWACQLQCTMSELCVTSTFWVIMVFLDLLQEGLSIGFWNML